MSTSFHEDGQPFSRSSGIALHNGKELLLRALQPLRLPFKSVFCFRKLQWLKTANLFQERTLTEKQAFFRFWVCSDCYWCRCFMFHRAGMLEQATLLGYKNGEGRFVQVRKSGF